MSSTVDIPHKLAEAMDELSAHGAACHCLVVVLPLREGMREVAEDFLAEGPPFAPEALGLARHTVFLTASEAIFVFETERGLASLDGILAEPDFWTVEPAWEHIAAGEPRVATAVFEWPERHRG